MGETRPPPTRVDTLISQDRGISESQLQEFRMNLEKSLEKLERQAESSRKNAIRSVAAVLVCLVFAFLINSYQALAPAPNQILAPIWTACTWIAMITCATVLVRYWTKHRPALERGRMDLQIAMFGELQQQIAALNDRLGEKQRSQP